MSYTASLCKQRHTKQRHTKQRHTKQRHTKQRHTKQRHTKQHHTKQHHTKQHHTKQRHTKQRHTKQHHTKQRHTKQRHTKQRSLRMQAALPYGFAQRLLNEFRAAAAAGRGAEASSAAAASAAKSQTPEPVAAGRYRLRVGEMATTFSGAISLDGRVGHAVGATRPLSSVSALKLTGAEGGAVPLASAVRAADEQASDAVNRLLSGGGGAAAPSAARANSGGACRGGASGSGASSSGAAGRGSGGPPTESELELACASLRSLLSGLLPPTSGEALLLALAHRSPPSISVLKATKAGVLVKKLRSFRYAPVAALASSVLDAWRAAAEMEERRSHRVAVLQGDTKAAGKRNKGAGGAEDGAEGGGGGGGGGGADGGGGEASLVPSDPVRSTAVVMLGEALKAAGAAGGTARGGAAELAASIERAVFAHHGGAVSKDYKVKCRSLATLLRTARAARLRSQLVEGTMSAAELVAFDADATADALQTDEERVRKRLKREKEARAIDMLRAENQGEASSQYKCVECGSHKCNLFETNSMGAVHLTSVPDMIVQCLMCGHRFTV